ncbi:Phage-related protein [Turicibacter sanguinis]|nr:Phage-related protein [Turicibacter sanguinis]
MIPILYEKDGTTKKITLDDSLEAYVIEERNGDFELELTYPVVADEYKNLDKEKIIICDANDYLKNQLFRIYNIRKSMKNRVKVYAKHISFDLAYDWIDSISIENQPCDYALNTIFRNSQFCQHYKGYSDIVNAQNFKVNKVTCLKAIGGTSGSIIDTYGTGAEILRDNTNIYVLNKRGRDNDVTIEYRKNLTGLEVQEDTTDLVTRIMPYAIYTDGDNQEVEVRGDFIDSPLINNYAHPYVKYIDYSDKFEDDEIPTKTKFNNLATKEYTVNQVDIPKCNYKIEFIPLSKCAGYEGLEDRINLCDVVTIKDSRYNINTQAKVIKVVFDVLRGRYDSMELGEPRTTLGDIIGGTGDGPTQGPPGPPGPQGPAGADGSIGDFPQTLPTVPTITAKVYGFANIELNWTFENKVYYSYELYASKTKGFTPNSFNLIFSGQASTFLYQVNPNETWYFKACALNTHGQRTEFSKEIQASTVKISDLSNYVESAAIGDALIGELNLGRGWYGELKGNYIDARQLSVTDGSGKRTLDIDSFGNVNLDVTSLKIKNNSVATESFVSNAKNDAINSANNNTTIALENHYTKSETDGKISVAKDEINLGVSSTYETKANVETKISDAIGDVQVGGANLWSETAWMDGAIMGDGTVSDYWLRPHVSYPDFVSVGNNKYITYQCWNPNGIVNNTNYNRIVFYNLDKTLLGSVDVPILNGEPYQCAIWEILSGTKYIRFGVISDVEGGGYNTSLKFKFEFGNKPTEWSPNALDITNNITTAKNDAITSANNNTATVLKSYYTKEETNSQINIAKESIELGVSSTYETKANVETKVTNAIAESKILPDTRDTNENPHWYMINYPRQTITEFKRAETIGIPNSWDNYGTLQTVVPWNDNSGGLPVQTFRSNSYKTYERKGISDEAWGDWTQIEDTIGSQAKADTAYNNAVTSANNTLTTTIANYYTKTQTDSAINVAKEEINLGVSTKYETKLEVDSKINAIEVGGTNFMRNSSFQNEYNAVRHWGGNGGNFVSIDVPNALSGKGLEIGGVNYQGVYQCPTNNEIGVYTISFYLRTDSTNPLIMFSRWEGFCDEQLFTATNSWTRCSYVVNKTRTDANAIVFYLYHGTDYNKIQIHSVQVERGNKVTDWSPSPLDTISDIADAKNEAITSANNKLTTTIANYYTKEETNSRINVAKNEVTTTVSSLRTEVMNASYSNLLTNSDFFTIENDFPSGYHGKTSYVYLGGWLCDGAKTIHVNTTDVDLQWQGFFSPAVQTNEGQVFTASVYTATENLSGIDLNCGIELEWLDSNGNRVGTTGTVFKPSTNYLWERQIATGTAPSGTTQVRIFCWVQHKGAVWWGKPMLQIGSTCTAWTKGGDIDTTNKRLSTAEQKITDSAIISTVSKSFYTKTETDNKVTTVENSMSSSITQLSNQIATKVDVNGVKSTIEQNPSSVQIGFNKISDALTVSADGLVAKTQTGNKYFQLGYNGMTMYNPANGTHQWGKVAAINNKFTVASNGNSSGLSLGHHVNENYVEDILCDSNGVVTVQRQMNHAGIYNNTYGQISIRQLGQGGWDITGRSDSQSIKPGGANQGAIGSNTQYINQSWIANRYNPSSLEFKHLSHYVDDAECLKLVTEIQAARYFYKEYDADGNDITTFSSRNSQLGLIYEDVRACSGRDLLTNEEDKAINDYNMASVLWGATRNINTRLNEVEYENILLRERVEHLESLLKNLIH